VRRFISITLLLMFTLPLVSPLFAASTAEVNVPLCCRRNGKHHCMMGKAAQHRSTDAPKVGTASLRERCPYNLTSSVAVHIPFAPDQIQTAIYAGILSHPASHAQTEALLRISSTRSHQKRGPPSLLLPRS
jgi:hypothetical protein